MKNSKTKHDVIAAKHSVDKFHTSNFINAISCQCSSFTIILPTTVNDIVNSFLLTRFFMIKYLLIWVTKS
uniref:Uncharacterized protein n=1 Tax=Anguilla anguilla TaxID=7936 RepID=A0A0E9W7Y2_ANGAN